MEYALIVIITILFVISLTGFFAVETAELAVISRFGKFLRIAQPGLNWKVPFIDKLAGRMSLRVNQIILTMETKTVTVSRAMSILNLDHSRRLACTVITLASRRPTWWG